MKILVGANHLDQLGGSETFTYTLVEELSRRNLDVDVFTFHHGEVSDRIARLSRLISVQEITKNHYDLALISHNSIFSINFKSKCSIQICHGVLAPSLEEPSFWADKYVAVSQHVAKHLSSNYDIESEVIGNVINCKRFDVRKPINKSIKRILSLSQAESTNKILRQIGAELDIEIIEFSKIGISTWNLEEIINEADLVVSIGRGVYESMACGRPVLIYDERTYNGAFGDGLVTLETFNESAKFNCTGKRFRKIFTKESLIEEIKKYDSSISQSLRKKILEEFDVIKCIDRYLQLGKFDVEQYIEHKSLACKRWLLRKKFINSVIRFDDLFFLIEDFFKTPIFTSEEMDKAMLRLYGRKEWRYRDVEKNLFFQIPNRT